MTRFLKSLLVVGIITLFSTSLYANPGYQAYHADGKVFNHKLLSRLDHANVEIRTMAALKLAEQGCDFIQDRLIDMVQHETQYEARIVAVVALSKIGDDAALNALKNQLDQEQRQTVKTVIKGAIYLMEKKELLS
ncbi:MAG TPA: HEAT repeat domain-containing protein [bacterium]|nr:HEAT repeat domain-containing protein [bacterium]HPN44392.1 HEAT repeat domain-containing protein [bacterium]